MLGSDKMSDTYSDIDQYLSNLDETDLDNNSEKKYNNPLYKKWFKSKSQSGFLSLTPWNEALKLKIDIGKTSSDGKLLSSTQVFVNYIDFAAYLRSIMNGTAPTIYKANDRMGIPTDEGFVSYGGAILDGKPVSRIFKSHYWSNGESHDSSSFVWKTGHFSARKSESGAFIPDLKSPISVDSIKVSKQDISSISYILDLSLISHVSMNKDWNNV
jgi:hypothetical protein